MSKKLVLNPKGPQTYATLKRVYRAGETYNAEDLGKDAEDTLEDGTEVFVEFRGLSKSISIGKKEGSDEGGEGGEGADGGDKTKPTGKPNGKPAATV